MGQLSTEEVAREGRARACASESVGAVVQTSGAAPNTILGFYLAAQNTIDCIDPESQQYIISEAVTIFCAFTGGGEDEYGVRRARRRDSGTAGGQVNKGTRSRSFWGKRRVTAITAE